MKVSQSCPTLCYPMDYTVHGVLQVRILEWVAVLLSRELPNPRIKPRSSTLLEDSLPAEPQGSLKCLPRAYYRQSLPVLDTGNTVMNRKKKSHPCPEELTVYRRRLTGCYFVGIHIYSL